MTGRILGIDPGERNIGVAISDPTGTIASPHRVIRHVSRLIDAGVIAGLACENEVRIIVIGQALDLDGSPGFQARKAIRLAEAVRQQTLIPVILWDESCSTNIAKAARIEMGTRRKDRKGHLDSIAAVVILQSYLDANQGN